MTQQKIGYRNVVVYKKVIVKQHFCYTMFELACKQ
jgi:hypothetical protein